MAGERNSRIEAAIARRREGGFGRFDPASSVWMNIVAQLRSSLARPNCRSSWNGLSSLIELSSHGKIAVKRIAVPRDGGKGRETDFR
jgi:hypothetical protein